MAAHALLRGGCRVVMVERGDWLARGAHNWDAHQVRELLPAYHTETPYEVRGDSRGRTGAFHLVGGPSVLYGGVSLRFRERDFEHFPEVHGRSNADWPIDYEALRPSYAEAERLLGVAGPTATSSPGSGRGLSDPTEPPRADPWPGSLPPLSPISTRIAEATSSLGLRPFALPLAIQYTPAPGRTACVQCNTCDGFACAIEAKNDLSTVVLPRLIAEGLDLRTGTVVTRVIRRGRRALGVECVDLATGARSIVRAGGVVLAAGALATPHILLASGLEHLNPAGDLVGRYLMRHVNGMVFGIFPDLDHRPARFHKQIGTNDLYFGHPSFDAPHGKLGSIQQVHAPPVALLQSRAPRAAKRVLAGLVERTTGLLVMAEDQPRHENRVRLTSRRNRFGMPVARIVHRYSRRDRLARRALMRVAGQILEAAGARIRVGFRVATFSHAVGTVRFGDDPRTAPLDPTGRFRGVENLWVTDGSFMPTSAAVNPSLTIAAHALRAGGEILSRPARSARLEGIRS